MGLEKRTTMNKQHYRIQTERLDLVPFASAHLDGLFAMNSDPQVMRYLGDVQTRDETAEGIARVQRRWETYGFSWWAVLLRGTDQVIGAACVQHLARNEDAPLEIGWRLAAAHHGKGYATEAGRAAMDYGFDRVGVDYLVAVTDVENVASQKVMQRLGMTYRGVETHYDQPCTVYEIHRP